MKTPDTAMTVHTYSELEDFAHKFADGKFNLLGVVSTPGLSKTQTFTAALKHDEHLLVKGHWRAFGLYEALYRHLDEPVLIDDADTLFQDRTTKPLLKALCETTETKHVTWHTKAADDADLPRHFTTRSRVAVLANEWGTFTATADMRAVANRGHWIDFRPTVREVHRQVGTWFKNDEIYDFVGNHLHLITTPSMRCYVMAAELKAAGFADWRDKTLGMLNPDLDWRAIEVVSGLLAKTGMTENQRILQFKKRTGMSRATWFRYKKLLADRREDGGG